MPMPYDTQITVRAQDTYGDRKITLWTLRITRSENIHVGEVGYYVSGAALGCSRTYRDASTALNKLLADHAMRLLEIEWHDGLDTVLNTDGWSGMLG